MDAWAHDEIALLLSHLNVSLHPTLIGVCKTWRGVVRSGLVWRTRFGCGRGNVGEAVAVKLAHNRAYIRQLLSDAVPELDDLKLVAVQLEDEPRQDQFGFPASVAQLPRSSTCLVAAEYELPGLNDGRVHGNLCAQLRHAFHIHIHADHRVLITPCGRIALTEACGWTIAYVHHVFDVCGAESRTAADFEELVRHAGSIYRPGALRPAYADHVERSLENGWTESLSAQINVPDTGARNDADWAILVQFFFPALTDALVNLLDGSLREEGSYGRAQCPYEVVTSAHQFTVTGSDISAALTVSSWNRPIVRDPRTLALLSLVPSALLWAPFGQAADQAITATLADSLPAIQEEAMTQFRSFLRPAFQATFVPGVTLFSSFVEEARLISSNRNLSPRGWWPARLYYYLTATISSPQNWVHWLTRPTEHAFLSACGEVTEPYFHEHSHGDFGLTPLSDHNQYGEPYSDSEAEFTDGEQEDSECSSCSWSGDLVSSDSEMEMMDSVSLWLSEEQEEYDEYSSRVTESQGAELYSYRFGDCAALRVRDEIVNPAARARVVLYRTRHC